MELRRKLTRDTSMKSHLQKLTPMAANLRRDDDDTTTTNDERRRHDASHANTAPTPRPPTINGNPSLRIREKQRKNRQKINAPGCREPSLTTKLNGPQEPKGLDAPEYMEYIKWQAAEWPQFLFAFVFLFVCFSSLFAFVASVAFGFGGFCGLWLWWLSWLLAFVASVAFVAFGFRGFWLSWLLSLLQAAHLWIWCAAGGGRSTPPTPPAPRNLRFISDARACHEINILR